MITERAIVHPHPWWHCFFVSLFEVETDWTHGVEKSRYVCSLCQYEKVVTKRNEIK